jgi:hypothetical protein
MDANAESATILAAYFSATPAMVTLAESVKARRNGCAIHPVLVPWLGAVILPRRQLLHCSCLAPRSFMEGWNFKTGECDFALKLVPGGRGVS